MGYWEDSSPEIEEMRRHGVDIGSKYGGQTNPPVSLCILDHPTPKSTQVEITLAEGRNRQVRRMFHAIQSGVMKLERMSIGPTTDNSINGHEALTCGGLKHGQWRVLTDNEVVRYLDWKPRALLSKHAATRDAARGCPRTRAGRRQQSL